jgi:hypothetical protein
MLESRDDALGAARQTLSASHLAHGAAYRPAWAGGEPATSGTSGRWSIAARLLIPRAASNDDAGVCVSVLTLADAAVFVFALDKRGAASSKRLVG